MLLGDRVGAAALLAKALREGRGGRVILHLFAAFDGLRGYAPFDILIRPVEDSAHLARLFPH